MKNNNSKLKIFLLCAVVFSFSLFVFSSSFAPAFAQKEGYKLTVPLPGAPERITGPAQYIKYLYQFGLGVGALLAIGIIVFAGIKYSVSAGNAAQQEDARDMIQSAVLGLALLLGAVLIMYTINPKLIGLGALEMGLQLPPIDPPKPAAQDPSLTEKRIKSLDLGNASLPRLRELKNFYEKDCAIQKANLDVSRRSVLDTPGLEISGGLLKDQISGDPEYQYLKNILSEEEFQSFLNNEGWRSLATKESQDRATEKLTECYAIINGIDQATENKKAAQSADSMQGVDLATLQSRYEQVSRLLEAQQKRKYELFDQKGSQSPEYLQALKVFQSLQNELAQLDTEIKRQEALKK